MGRDVTVTAALLRHQHLPLLRHAHGGTPANPDGIVVPSNRPLSWLAGYLQRAAPLCCPLVILWTPRTPVPWSSGGRIRWIHRGRSPAALVTLPPGFRPPWPAFASAAVTDLARPGRSDVDLKRNLGLLIAVLLGWRTVLFTDDDVGDHRMAPDVASVRTAVGVLERADAQPPVAVATWRTVDFPDNSVVCHARRAVGLDQDVFVGGTLLTRVGPELPFFPPVYNEDWLFLYPWLVEGRVHYAGDMPHDRFDPFEDPHRAAREEFGDLLGEGLFALLHDRVGLGSVTPAYWQRVIDARHRMLADIRGGLDRVADPRRRDRVDVALQRAQSQLDRIGADLLHAFVVAWQADLLRWRRELARWEPVRPADDGPRRIEQALDRLGLREHVAWASWR